VLKMNRYFIESNFPEIIRTLLKDDTMKQALVPSSVVEPPPVPVKVDDGFTAVITLDREDEQDMEKNESDFTSSFEIARTLVEDVRKRCVELDFPLTEVYDFRGDLANSSLEIDLSPKCVIRDYQEKSLSKMFGGGGGRARSGIIVLPTGGIFIQLTLKLERQWWGSQLHVQLRRIRSYCVRMHYLSSNGQTSCENGAQSRLVRLPNSLLITKQGSRATLGLLLAHIL
jgi:hypothetical protein